METAHGASRGAEAAVIAIPDQMERAALACVVFKREERDGRRVRAHLSSGFVK
jgi:hypothetical protein